MSDGSSKQGKARRASVASNCVTAYLRLAVLLRYKPRSLVFRAPLKRMRMSAAPGAIGRGTVSVAVSSARLVETVAFCVDADVGDRDVPQVEIERVQHDP